MKKIQEIIHILFYLSLLSLLINNKCFPQNQTEFVIRDSSFINDIKIDNENNLYVLFNRKDEIFYIKYDSLFNPVSENRYFNNTSKTSNPKFAIRNNYLVSVWWDFKDIMFYSSSIIGNISNLNEEVSQNNFGVNIGASPQICFVNDTTFFIVWSSEG